MAATGVLNLEELEDAARAALDPAVHAFFAGGAGDERTLRANRAAFARRLLRPRVLVDVSAVDASTTVLGTPVSLPVLAAPIGYLGLLRPEGERAVARACARAGTIQCLAEISEASPREVAEAAPGAPRWFQLYCFRDRGLNAALAAEAAESGCSALVVTVDGPVLGRREGAIRAGFAAPDSYVLNGPSRVLGRDVGPAELAGLLDAAIGWDDVAGLAAGARLPLVVKGVLTAEDADAACAHGAAGVVVSNHGGRQLDGVPASLDALEEVVAAVAGRAEVLVDGGVRRGTDVAVALALGARAVLVGRPLAWALASGGEDGVVEALGLLREELETALALLGRPAVPELGPDAVAAAP